MVNFLHMRKLIKVGIAFVVIILVIGVILFVISISRKAGAGFSVETSPTATVYVNGEQVGRTPYKAIREAGEIVVKLVPDSFEKPLAPYEAKVTLTSSVETYLRRDFGENEDLSSGATISFESIGGKSAELAVISIPDSANVRINGVSSGTTPFKTETVTTTEQQLTLQFPGFVEKSFSIRPQVGYRLTAFIKLAPSTEVLGTTIFATPEATSSLAPTPTPAPKTSFVQILSTDTGYLRVRSGPGSGYSEVGKVEPNKKYPFIEKDEKSGWFKIEYQVASTSVVAKVGWVSNQYAKIVDGSATVASPTSKTTPSPSPTPR